MTYDPFFGERPAPAAHRRSDAAWAQVREDYLAGASAPQLSERFGVSVSALRKRAREEGWRRSDSPDTPPPEEEDDEAALAEAAADGPADLRPLAWARAALAVRRGRLQEALGWTRLVRQLDRMAEAQAASPALQARAAASLASAAETLDKLRERLPRLRRHEVHEMHEVHAASAILPRAAGAGQADRAQPDGGGDPPATPGGEPAPSVGLTAAPSPAAAPQGSSGVHDLHEVHASKIPSCAAVAGEREKPGGAADPPSTPAGEPAPSPAAAPQGRSGALAPPRPTGPAVPPVPPDWVRWRLQAR